MGFGIRMRRAVNSKAIESGHSMRTAPLQIPAIRGRSRSQPKRADAVASSWQPCATTITWAHHGLLHDNRGQLKLGLFLTILLGVVFLGFQVYEYTHAYSDLNVKLTTGVFGSLFYLLTGFHGFHVTIGATMLIVILCRVFAGHFTSQNHFGFEAVAWYWHFVDVVWLLLFVVVYWI